MKEGKGRRKRRQRGLDVEWMKLCERQDYYHLTYDTSRNNPGFIEGREKGTHHDVEHWQLLPLA